MDIDEAGGVPSIRSAALATPDTESKNDEKTDVLGSGCGDCRSIPAGGVLAANMGCSNLVSVGGFSGDVSDLPGAAALADAALMEDTTGLGGVAATAFGGVFAGAADFGFLLTNFGGKTALGLLNIFGLTPDGAIFGKLATGTLPSGITVLSGENLMLFGCGDAGELFAGDAAGELFGGVLDADGERRFGD